VERQLGGGRLRVLRAVSDASGLPPPTPNRMSVGTRCPLKVGATESRVPSEVATKCPVAQVPLGHRQVERGLAGRGQSGRRLK
jgi:hypothetical protein